MLSKLQRFVNKDILRLVYYVIFRSHLTDLCLVWAQAKFSWNRITLLQKRAIRMLHSASFRDHSFPLFHKQKFADLVSLENGRFVNKCFNKNDFSLFSNLSNLIASSHSYCTRSISNGLMFKRFYSPNRYGNKSIIIS